MITTVTPNPSLDRTLHIDQLVRGAGHRAAAESIEPSGKGVNVALALHRAGAEVTAVLPVGGYSGAHLLAMLGEAGLPHRPVTVAGAIRSNVSVVEDDGTTTKLNEVGPTLQPDEIDRLLSTGLAIGQVGDWIAYCGSLPAGFGAERLADAVAEARTAGRLVALDTSGKALATALDQSSERLPHLIKPNAEELAELTGRSLFSIGDVTAAARSLLDRGVRTVLVSLGADGAVLVERGVELCGKAPITRVVNTVGAGDAFLAGYLCAHAGSAHVDHGPGVGAAAARLAHALRFGTAAVQHEGTLFDTVDLDRPVKIEPADPERQLQEPIFVANR